MNPGISRQSPGEGGFALLMVMAFMVVSFLIISGVLYSTSNAALQTDRHQRYYMAREAAAAAAERAVAGMVRDLHATGWAGPLANYQVLPDTTECPEWVDYDFALEVTQLSLNNYSELTWKYRGMSATNDLYRVRARARTLDLDVPIASVVEQRIQMARIPLFSFMGYSDFDMSFVSIPENNITLNGRIHSNRDIFCFPSGSLVFSDNVTASGDVRSRQHPADDFSRTLGSLGFLREVDSHANTMRLAPGFTNSYALLTQLSGVADLFVVVSNDTFLVHDGFTAYSSTVWTNFINTNINFYDSRELRGVHATEFDVAGYRAQLGGAGSPKLIYLDDITDYGVDTNAAFRLVNGQNLGGGALSVVTTNALYVKGDYNSINRVPAMLAADAVTLLSGAWDDSDVGIGAAVSTTLNAAVMTGTVPSDPNVPVFDGGLFNAVRLLEDWSGDALTFRGSIATPFRSRHAKEPWRGDYYVPPTTRSFSYETGYLNPSWLPKGTPALHVLIRGELLTLAPTTL